MRIRLSNITLNDGILDADFDQLDDRPPNPPPISSLPEGYDTDEGIAYGMLMRAVREHNLDPIAMQGHGRIIAEALNETWPGLNAYSHPQSDAVMWPGFGSLDVTIDSGKKGWYFKVDNQGKYDHNQFLEWDR